jgi:DNA polymerase (family X)
MSDAPTVEVLLDIDREYRDKARAGLLPKIAPRRFNPEHEPWLPVLHTRYGPWRFTALFSNTELAHDMHRTHDWVVVFFSEPDGEEGQVTVVTERRGALAGRRVVRGREPECAQYYDSVISTERAGGPTLRPH